MNLLQNAVFVHSHIFIYDENGNVYSTGQFPAGIWDRYLRHFSNLMVLGRSKTSKEVLSYNLSSRKNVKHIPLPNISVVKNRRQKMKRTKEILFETITECDIVIARLPSTQGNLAIQVAKELEKPYVIELVGDVFSSLWFHGNMVAKLFAPFSFLKVRKILKEAPYVLYVTEEFLQQKYPSKKLKVTSSCSNVEIEVRDKVEIQIEKNIPFSIGMIGSYSSKYKGIDNAINVVKKFIDNGVNVELKILGSGDSSWIKEKIHSIGLQDIVKIDGSLPAGEEVIKWLRSLDIYIQPSLTEGLPRGLIEAMSCSLPCVASNVGGIPELLDSGCMHAPKDEEDMFNKILKIYEDKEFRKKEGEKNFLLSQKYTKEKLDEKRRVFWNEVSEDIRRNSK